MQTTLKKQKNIKNISTYSTENNKKTQKTESTRTKTQKKQYICHLPVPYACGWRRDSKQSTEATTTTETDLSFTAERSEKV
mmetsp:Transcript_61336/g.97670  ORF Transcript_61336/g.97670 Transcript_61336/m.97670 type:complete len:81 (-) Transcript_61336:1289-1531(-)